MEFTQRTKRWRFSSNYHSPFSTWWEMSSIILCVCQQIIFHFPKHHLGYVHRDVKAENVLVISEEHVKLGDFGFSTQITGSQHYLNTFCGSPPYASPELFNDDHYLGGPVDIWALGILLFFILIGNMPFSAPTVPQLRSTILKGKTNWFVVYQLIESWFPNFHSTLFQTGEYRIPGHFTTPCVKLIRESSRDCVI